MVLCIIRSNIARNFILNSDIMYNWACAIIRF